MPGLKLFSEKKCQIWGWLLFIVSALFYGAAAIRVGDLLAILGSLAFLVACFVFLIPFVFPGRFR
ncbi:MAG: hypothetical protein H8D87_13890 [Deltaproteobacteria bacterium]|uniref:hypothetical protein n=1 Tax=Desulfobacula sp. TaxID=2593537 RepID=UPI0019B708EA|nr:hypothetical protein [Candidatus Desulfobacula maris]MBL6992497.1 hypothetical protein [Desulfobacula sp.]